MITTYLTLCREHPRRILAVAGALTVLLSCVTFGRLNFTADRGTLFRASQEQIDQQREFERRFGDWKSLVLVVDGATENQREEAVRDYAKLLRSLAIAHDVRDSLDLKDLGRVSLYLVELEELQRILQALQRHRKVLQGMAEQGWYGFLQAVNTPSGGEVHVPDRERFAHVWEQAVRGRGSAALDHLFPQVELPKRLFFQDGRHRHLIFFSSDQPLALQEILDNHESPFPGRVVLTGQPLLEALERQESLHDALISTVIAIVVIQFLLVRGFRETARPRLGFLSLMFGLFWSVAWAAASTGTLNIITINFLAITVGLGIDFSIHILARYSEERLQREPVPAMVETMRTSGRENLVGALATSLAFWALYLTDFQAVRELGLITGVAVPLCFLSVVTLFPPLLFWWEGKRASPPAFRAEGVPWLQPLEETLRREPRRGLGVAVVVVALLCWLSSGVEFDYNLLNMQSPNSAAVRYEQEGGFNSLAAYVIAEDAVQARDLARRLETLPSVSQVHSVADLLPANVAEKRPLVKQIVEVARSLPRPRFDAESEPDWERLQSLSGTLGGRTEAGEPQPDWIVTLRQSGPGPVGDIWRQMQSHLKSELTRSLEILASQDTDFKLASWLAQHEDIGRLANPDGKVVLRVQAHGVLWEKEVLEQFARDIETVTSEGLGPPFLIRDYLQQLRDSYYAAVRYAVLAIVILLMLHFRSIGPALVALVPKVVGAIGMFAAMGLCGVDLNPANCMALPLTLGIGLVFGIHAVHRCLDEPERLLVEGSTGRAIALSGLTTIASFGTLMSASHPGIFSLGFVMASGVLANMAATYLLVPPCVSLFFRR